MYIYIKCEYESQCIPVSSSMFLQFVMVKWPNDPSICSLNDPASRGRLIAVLQRMGCSESNSGQRKGRVVVIEEDVDGINGLV